MAPRHTHTVTSSLYRKVGKRYVPVTRDELACVIIADWKKPICPVAITDAILKWAATKTSK